MFSPALVCRFVGLFVCLLAGLLQKSAMDLNEIFWRGGCGTMKNPLDFGGDPDSETVDSAFFEIKLSKITVEFDQSTLGDCWKQ